jgi:hypothetical protein
MRKEKLKLLTDSQQRASRAVLVGLVRDGEDTDNKRLSAATR